MTHEELTKLQQTVARRMAESKATAPHFQLSAEIDMSRAVAARARIKAAAKEGDVVPSFNDMVVKACAIALREHPRANGAYRDGRLELYSRVNVGVAVAAQDALVVPTIFDADLKGLRQIASEARALAQRVRDGTVTPPELSGGTFTVSNLGMYGISNFQAVINPPQAGILAVGAITETPVVRDGEIATAHLMGVTLACDHRDPLRRRRSDLPRSRAGAARRAAAGWLFSSVGPPTDLPFIDEHAIEVAAPPERVWEAVRQTVSSSFGGRSDGAPRPPARDRREATPRATRGARVDDHGVSDRPRRGPGRARRSRASTASRATR